MSSGQHAKLQVFNHFWYGPFPQTIAVNIKQNDFYFTIREGRATMVSAFASFKFGVAFCFTQLISVLMVFYVRIPKKRNMECVEHKSVRISWFVICQNTKHIWVNLDAWWRHANICLSVKFRFVQFCVEQRRQAAKTAWPCHLIIKKEHKQFLPKDFLVDWHRALRQPVPGGRHWPCGENPSIPAV